MTRLEISCDLGEGESRERTLSFMKSVTAVNLACGSHAGDESTMDYVVGLAKDLGVRVGAHPGLAGDYGRGDSSISAAQFRELVKVQVARLQTILEKHSVPLSHLKLHGSIYHLTETNAQFTQGYLDLVSAEWPGLPVLVLSGGLVATLARNRNQPFWNEIFIDRANRNDGSLVPRSEAGALLKPHEMEEKLLGLGDLTGNQDRTNEVTCFSFHSDTPGIDQVIGESWFKALLPA